MLILALEMEESLLNPVQASASRDDSKPVKPAGKSGCCRGRRSLHCCCCGCCCRFSSRAACVAAHAVPAAAVVAAVLCVLFLVVLKKQPLDLPAHGPCPAPTAFPCPPASPLAVTGVSVSSLSFCFTARRNGSALLVERWFSGNTSVIHVGRAHSVVLPAMDSDNVTVRVRSDAPGAAWSAPVQVSVPPCGLCAGHPDLAVLKGLGAKFKTKFRSCALPCEFAHSCTSDCLHKDMHASRNCSDCLASLAPCMKDKCLPKCIEHGFQSSECRGCISTRCVPDIAGCSGLPPAVILDFVAGGPELQHTPQPRQLQHSALRQDRGWRRRTR